VQEVARSTDGKILANRMRDDYVASLGTTKGKPGQVMTSLVSLLYGYGDPAGNVAVMDDPAQSELQHARARR